MKKDKTTFNGFNGDAHIESWSKPSPPNPSIDEAAEESYIKLREFIIDKCKGDNENMGTLLKCTDTLFALHQSLQQPREKK